MFESPDRIRLIRQYCERPNLRTSDPYDIWKTSLGFHTKNFYNRHRLAGLPGAALLTLFDAYLNDRTRFFYSRQEYPIVRALAALALLKIYAKEQDTSLLRSVHRHLDWLCQHSCIGYSGPCWGLGFRYAVDKGLVYGVNTPLTTMTPYALEAFVEYTRLTGDRKWLPTIRGIFRFLERDVPILEETDDYLVTAYSTIRDRKVVNAVSYVMYSYSLLLPYLDAGERGAVVQKIQKLYYYIRLNQGADGSWLYSAEQPSFIDCFHSCFVMKNVLKTAQVIELDACSDVVSCGYRFLKENMLVAEKGLTRRFAKTNKPGLISFDLYDNSEMLNLANMIGDLDLARTLDANIARTFVHRGQIYSQIDRFGIRHGPNMLRWAVMPYLYASASLEEKADGMQPKKFEAESTCARLDS